MEKNNKNNQKNAEILFAKKVFVNNANAAPTVEFMGYGDFPGSETGGLRH